MTRIEANNWLEATKLVADPSASGSAPYALSASAPGKMIKLND
jgi:hypothetical protein